MVFLDRRKAPGPDPRLAWKVRLFFLAAGLGIAGIAIGNDPLVGAGIGLLLVGVLLRWIPAGRKGEESGEEPPGGEGEEG